LQPDACGGNAEQILTRFQEAVREVMLAEGVGFDAAMQPPEAAEFLSRDVEEGYEEVRDGVSDVAWSRRL